MKATASILKNVLATLTMSTINEAVRFQLDVKIMLAKTAVGY
jgi:hypothetical protein